LWLNKKVGEKVLMECKRWNCALIALSLFLILPRFPNNASSQTLAAKPCGSIIGSRLPGSGTEDDKQRAFIRWARENAIPLKTVEAGNGFTDISRIADIVNGSQIVALGEATHGSREFFQLKHRMIEFLATQKGFSTFAIEANMPEAYRLNDFVLHGKGDPRQLLRGMYFWTWNVQEVLDLVLWMREFNQSGKGRIEFTGFDMQNPRMAIEVVKNYVQQQEPGYLSHVQSVYDTVQMVRSSRSPAQSVDLKQLAKDCGLIEKRLDQSSGRSSTPPVIDADWAIQMARLVQQWVQMQGGEKSRDESMAENLEWIARRSPRTKLVLWAHNGHVTYDGDSYKPMGAYLKEAFGPRLVTFGFVFNRGSFRALDGTNGTREVTIGPAPGGSLDHALASTGIPWFALDLRRLAQNSQAAQWASEPHLSRSIGAVYAGPDDPSTTVEVPVNRRFDAILFVNETSASRPNQMPDGHLKVNSAPY
jgi:erythromycin esterase